MTFNINHVYFSLLLTLKSNAQIIFKGKWGKSRETHKRQTIQENVILLLQEQRKKIKRNENEIVR